MQLVSRVPRTKPLHIDLHCLPRLPTMIQITFEDTEHKTTLGEEEGDLHQRTIIFAGVGPMRQHCFWKSSEPMGSAGVGSPDTMAPGLRSGCDPNTFGEDLFCFLEQGQYRWAEMACLLKQSLKGDPYWVLCPPAPDWIMYLCVKRSCSGASRPSGLVIGWPRLS